MAACRANGWGVHTHLAEVREELTESRTRWGMSTIQHADRVGLLDHPVIAGHCIWCAEADIGLLASRDVAVSHNPVANMILASGVCPVGRLRREGIAVGLGTDGAASNDNQDMFGVLKTAALLQKVHALDPHALSAADVMRMATIEGARALGLDRDVGSLEPGKRADVVLLDGDTPELATIHDPFQQVVYCATARCVSDVWVDGSRRVAEGRVVDADVVALARDARRLGADLVTRAGQGAESVLAGPGRVTWQSSDVVVIGAGHNGLACAAYLARAGLGVTVVEQGDEAGGCISTVNLPDGRGRLEIGAYEHGGILGSGVADDLELARHGLEFHLRDEVTLSPCDDGTALAFHNSLGQTVNGLGPVVGAEDAEAYRRFATWSAAACAVLRRSEAGPAPTLRELSALSEATLGPREGRRLVQTLLSSAANVVRGAIADERLRGALGHWAAHSQQSPGDPGTAAGALVMAGGHGFPAARPVGGSRSTVERPVRQPPRRGRRAGARRAGRTGRGLRRACGGSACRRRAVPRDPCGDLGHRRAPPAARAGRSGCCTGRAPG